MLRAVPIDICRGDECIDTDLDLPKPYQQNIHPGKVNEPEIEVLPCPNTNKRKKDFKYQEMDQENALKKNKLIEIDEPKPRIVLTFRSEKTGLKSSNMKIVSTEEKHEDSSIKKPVKSRGGDMYDKHDDEHEEDICDSTSTMSPKKNKSQPVSESDEGMSDSSHTALKRSTLRRSKEFSDNVLANAIARKEKSYNETALHTIPQRLSRRIKPTAKILANKELRIGLETQNNARMGITNTADKSPEDGVQTRRSLRRKSIETHLSDDNSKMTSPIATAPRKKRTLLKHPRHTSEEIKDHNNSDHIVQSAGKDHELNKNEKENSQEREIRRLNKLKKKHLSKLGLKAVDGDRALTEQGSTIDTDAIVEHLDIQNSLLETQNSSQNESEQIDGTDNHELEDDVEELELDEDPELLDELLAPLSDPDTSDEDFEYAVPAAHREVPAGTPRRSTRRDCSHSEMQADNAISNQDDSKEAPPRRSKRLKKGHLGMPTSSATNSEYSDLDEDDDNRSPRRRSSRRKEYFDVQVAEDRNKGVSDIEQDDNSDPAGGDEGSEATCPEEGARSMATCYCADSSNLYVAASEITEPMFCRAVELIEGVRVGCSHRAALLPDGTLAPLRRAGPRSPFLLACALHTAQLRRHMCCAACGIFCTQGTYYQCSEGHLFHLECGLPYGGTRVPPGCPHCGFYSQGSWPCNRRCVRVKLDMQCSNKRILLPEQREQCAPAYLGFSTLDPDKLEHEPIIPEDLLPASSSDVKKLFDRLANSKFKEAMSKTSQKRLCEVIIEDLSTEELVPLILSVKVNRTVEGTEGGTYMHLAARSGNLAAAYLLQYAGAALNRTDASLRSPLMLAVLTLLDKSTSKSKDQTTRKDATGGMGENKDGKSEPNKSAKSERDVDISERNAVKPESEVEREKALMKVIRYLVAAGCDVNQHGPDGMTALHMAAQYGGADVCAALLAAQRAAVDPRDHGGWTPLVWAAENRHPAVVRLLLSRGADAAACDTEGNAVLHWCALAGDANSLQLLLDKAPGHALDALNAHGDTPLHVAARQGHYSCVVILLARGARTDIKNSSGDLAVEVCTDECQSAVSLHMQVAHALRDRVPSQIVLSSDISNGREAYPIPCINEVDEAPAPMDFTYVTRHVMPYALHIDDTIAVNQGCACKGEECGGGGECACCTLGIKRWYVRDAPRLAPNFPYHEPPMLFECNQTCGCDLRKCSNAVVTRLCERGSMLVRAEVFRCGEARGWGLRAAAPVPRGAPVATYCGELLSVGRADTRQRDQYMFALDIKQDLIEQCEDQTQLCVDAAAYGSAARFINHSCRPNLAPVRVFTRHRDLRLPTVTLFATKDIRPMDEFTFDYGDKFWSVKSKWMRCECNAPDCRYPTKTSDEDAEV